MLDLDHGGAWNQPGRGSAAPPATTSAWSGSRLSSPWTDRSRAASLSGP
ncbi:hypothetical protein [Streptomyces lydicus]|nr:hypothetical protein [Streptomyces lydicus]